MSRQRLFIVHGMGNDAIGLVGRITTPIAAVGGNIVDLRQDVLHGLFTIYLVVDLMACDLRIDKFKEIIKSIAEDTGLELSVEAYHPVARNPEKKNILIILVGYDKPGIIASIAQILGNYKANIEFAKNIGREDLFLMELLVDISHCAIPLDNLMSLVTQKMNEKGITAIIQTEDVFNKKKRVILFDFRDSLIPTETILEVLQQTGLKPEDIESAYPIGNLAGSITKAAQLLDGLSVDVINTIAQNISVEDGTIELLQTLKIMGYKICVVSNGFSIFVNILAQKLGIDHSYGVELQIDHDSRIVNGEITAKEIMNRSIDFFKKLVAQKEQINVADVTVVSDAGLPEAPAIRIVIELEKILDMYNKRVISRDNLVGLLGSLGMQRI
jgi:phosphoserine phosphatase